MEKSVKRKSNKGKDMTKVIGGSTGSQKLVELCYIDLNLI